jgi:arsenical pump membrane protein
MHYAHGPSDICWAPAWAPIGTADDGSARVLRWNSSLMLLSSAHIATWSVAALAILGVIVRPWKLPEALWAVVAAVALLIFGLISLPDAGKAVLKGVDVYLFLIGMMLLAELARHEGLFDWLAAFAIKHSKGSPTRLFVLVYLVGTIVTVFLSNDATAVVLTPAVYAAAKKAKANPLSYLYICAFIANAASFVLPISNPANLVVYGSQMPSLSVWIAEFGLASLVSIIVTFGVLRLMQKNDLTGTISRDIQVPELSRGGRLAAGGIGLTAAVLLIASSLDWQLGLPTFVAGSATALLVMIINRLTPWDIAKDISWSVLPLVAGLFVLVEAVEETGLLKPLLTFLPASAASAPNATGLVMGALVAVLCNVVNNLPLGLVAGSVAMGAHLSPHVTGALLIGVDLGPNLSVTGSLATILWLVALRREGQAVSGWQFLKLGCVVMPPALLASLGAFIWLKTH